MDNIAHVFVYNGDKCHSLKTMGIEEGVSNIKQLQK